jgi:hypothetical protein
MEEVETFDAISLDDLAEGARDPPRPLRSRRSTAPHRTPREQPALRRALVRAHAPRRPALLPPRPRQLGADHLRRRPPHAARERAPRLPDPGTHLLASLSAAPLTSLRRLMSVASSSAGRVPKASRRRSSMPSSSAEHVVCMMKCGDALAALDLSSCPMASYQLPLSAGCHASSA